MRGTRAITIIIVSLFITNALSFISTGNNTTEVDDALGSISPDNSPQAITLSKTVEVPAGKDYYMWYDEATETLKSMQVPDITSGLNQSALDALALVPQWLYDDLAKKFGYLADEYIDVGTNSTPTFADIDQDGDMDLVVGEYSGIIKCYENIDNALHYYEGADMAVNAIYVEDTTSFSGIDVGGNACPTFADLDNDGDEDLTIGADNGNLYYYRNDIGSWTYVASMYSGVSVAGYSAPDLADMDGDSDFDLTIGNSNGTLEYYRNDGTVSSPSWQYVSNYYSGLDVGSNSKPTLTDMDDDGDLDLTCGNAGGTLNYYRNNGGSWTDQSAIFSGIDIGTYSSAALVDLDSDRCYDLVVGSSNGYLYYYENKGTSLAYEKLQWTDIDTSFNWGNYYFYYLDEVLLKHRSDTSYQDTYAGLITSAPALWVDEIAFTIAHTGTSTLKNDDGDGQDVYPQVFVDNAKYIYEIAPQLDYVELVEKTGVDGAYTTTKYWIDDPVLGRIQIEIPRDIYYWYIVHPKVGEELPTYVDPDEPNHLASFSEAPPVGRFWREFIFYHNDTGYPVLKDDMAGVDILWNRETNSGAPAAANSWIGTCIEFNSGAERPHQPVRIYKLHMGRCGEHQDMRAAVARTLLFPVRQISTVASDHVWDEFWDEGWIHWDGGGNAINNPNLYIYGWGKRIAILDGHRSDGLTYHNTPYYHKGVDYGNLTINVVDPQGNPIDGVRVGVGAWNNYGSIRVAGDGYNFTDSNGKVKFEIGMSGTAAENHGVQVHVLSKYGGGDMNAGYANRYIFNPGDNQEYTFIVPNDKHRPTLLATEEIPPATDRYIMEASYEVLGGYQYPPKASWEDDRMLNYHPHPVGDVHVDSFVVSDAELDNYLKGKSFQCFDMAKNATSDYAKFGIPSTGDWYYVISNRDSIETSKVVNISVQVHIRSTMDIEDDKYLDEDVVNLEVWDGHLNTMSGVTETVNIIMASGTEPGGETVTLTEQGTNSPVFSGTITISKTNGAGILQVVDGDTITATYNDADDGTGSPAVCTDTAIVDSNAVPVTDLTVRYWPAVDNYLFWTLSVDDGAGDNDIVQYNIYRANNPAGPWNAGTLIDTVPAGTDFYRDSNRGQADGTLWWYVIRAVDDMGNTADARAREDPTPPGTIVLDRNLYGGEYTVTMTVVDRHLNTDSGTTQTVVVTLDSTTEPAGESVTLTEQGTNSSTFVGTISVSKTNSVGVVQVSDGDILTATYIDMDSDDVGTQVTVTDTALVDAQTASPTDPTVIWGNPWNSWSYRQKLTFDNSGQTDSLYDFPVLVKLNSGNFNYGNAKADGTDLRFVGKDGTALAYHMETWNPAGDSYIWVNVHDITGGSSVDHIWMYYGNSGAADIRSSEGTYNSNYVGVWHLNETSGTHYDSTSNNYDGIPNGGIDQNAVGVIGGADAFDGVDDMIDLPDNFDLFGNVPVSVSFFMNADIIDDGNRVVFCGGGEHNFFITFGDSLPNDTIGLRINDGGWKTPVNVPSIQTGQWYHISVTWDPVDGYVMYVNGDLSSTSPLTLGRTTRSGDNNLGSLGGATRWFEGLLDELKISNVARSADWIKAIYLSETDNFITYGGEVAVTGPEENNIINWTLSADDGAGENDILQYNIYRANNEFGPWGSGAYISNVPAGNDTYTDVGKGAMDGINWWYVIRAVDVLWNEDPNTDAEPEEYPPCNINITSPAGPWPAWRFISFPHSTSGNIETILDDSVLGDGGTTWDVAKWYNPQDAADPWKTYRKGVSTNDLTTIDNTIGVWVHLTGNGGDQLLTLSQKGAYSTGAVFISLYTGWNLVSYPSATARLASTTLPGAADMVAYYNNGATYLVTEALPTAVTFSEGNAYWVHVTADAVWSVAP